MVFRIGMRINGLWKIHKWVPVSVVVPRILWELEADNDSGLLGYEPNLGIRNQRLFVYWHSSSDLHEYARGLNKEHVPAWQEYNQEVRSDR